VRSKYLKENGDLFSLSRLVFEPFMVGRFSPEGKGCVMRQLWCCWIVLLLKGTWTGGAGDILCSLSAPNEGHVFIKIHLCKMDTMGEMTLNPCDTSA
jgi:hypothetical protein